MPRPTNTFSKWIMQWRLQKCIDWCCGKSAFLTSLSLISDSFTQILSVCQSSWCVALHILELDICILFTSHFTRHPPLSMITKKSRRWYRKSVSSQTPLGHSGKSNTSSTLVCVHQPAMWTVRLPVDEILIHSKAYRSSIHSVSCPVLSIRNTMGNGSQIYSQVERETKKQVNE